MAPKRKAPPEEPPAKRAKAEAKAAEPKGRAKAAPEPAPKGRAKAVPEAPAAKGRAKAEPESAPKGRVAAKAEPETRAPKAKALAKEAAPALARVSAADLDKELDTMIQASKDGEFDDVFKILDKYPPYVNERPEERRYSTIHQACYWGHLDTLKKLVEKYNADIFLTTKEGHSPIDVAKEHGHNALVKYLEDEVKKKTAPPPAPAGGRSRAGDRNRVAATRSDGNEEPDMDLTGVKKITLRLGADGGGILCGAALVYSGKKKEKAVCYCDKKYKDAVIHSGDSTVGKRRVHTINLDLVKMPKTVDKVYLTLCSCGPTNLQGYTNPSVELLGDDVSMIRYDLTDAGESQSTVMAVLEKKGSSWSASPVGAVCPAKFCGNYGAAVKLIEEANAGADDAAAKAKPASPARKPPASASSKIPSGDVVGYTAKELADFEEAKGTFASWTNDKLKNLLKENDQSRTGNKAVLIAKCAYGATFGRLGRCPKCFGAKVKFRLPGAEGKLYSVTTLFGGASGKDKDDEENGEKEEVERKRYYCTGYFDDDTKVECDWQCDTTEFESWTASS